MTPKAFRKLALSLPDAHEEPHFERTSFRVAKKIFATMTADGEQAMVRVSPPDKVFALLDTYPDVFFSHGTWTTKNGSLGVRLANADTSLIEELLTESWGHVAPKRTGQARDGSAAKPRRAASPARRTPEHARKLRPRPRRDAPDAPARRR
jgi:hypothetical protein